MISTAVSVGLAFLITFATTPVMIRYLSSVGIVGIDMNKKGKPILPSSGGVCVAIGLISGLLVYTAVSVFFYGASDFLVYILAAISSVLIVTFTGIFDDMNVSLRKVATKKGEKDIRVGIPQWVKPLMTLPAAIPLIAVNAGVGIMNIPFFGDVNFGLIYPLLLIPIGFVGASNMVNMLGGFNGIEAGMGFLYMSSLGIYAFLHGIPAYMIFLPAAAALLAFLFYNRYPAKILPGDSLTYLLGSVAAAGIIIGNMEKIGMIMLMPFIIEFFLKSRSRFSASSLGKLRDDGTLAAPYGKKIYSLTHVAMNLGRMNEKNIFWMFVIIQAVFCTIPFLLF